MNDRSTSWPRQSEETTSERACEVEGYVGPTTSHLINPVDLGSEVLPAASNANNGAILDHIFEESSKNYLSLLELAPFLISCIVCLEELPESSYPEHKVSAYCNHGASVCLDCLRKCIKNDHETKMWNDITCPTCTATLSYEEVKKLADVDTFKHYDELSFRTTVSCSPNFVWCLECTCGQIHVDGIEQPIVECQGCHAYSCFTHRVPWHYGMTCKEYDKLSRGRCTNFCLQIGTGVKLCMQFAVQFRLPHISHLLCFQTDFIAKSKLLPSKCESPNSTVVSLAVPEVKADANTNRCAETVMKRKEEATTIRRRKKEDTASRNTISDVCKQCPGCAWPIEKTDGCSHMICTKCTTQFCWKCRKPWAGVHKCWRI